jgi:hypothetical protein
MRSSFNIRAVQTTDNNKVRVDGFFPVVTLATSLLKMSANVTPEGIVAA